jgi:KaiC/GvpD/RAD55 family RecA-like ATPase
MERVSTGISGLDKLIGGYPKGSCVLISGSAGTGKTIFALHLAQATCASGKKVVYVAIEEKRSNLITQASMFGWDLDAFEKKGLLKFVSILESRMADAKYQYDSYGPESGFSVILEAIEGDVDVVIIDNLGILALDMSMSHFRQQLDYLVYALGYRGCTSLVICDETTMSKFGEVATYSVDGTIRLMRRDNPYTDSRERALEITKMRHTKHTIDYLLYEISDKGIKLQE